MCGNHILSITAFVRTAPSLSVSHALSLGPSDSQALLLSLGVSHALLPGSGDSCTLPPSSAVSHALLPCLDDTPAHPLLFG